VSVCETVHCGENALLQPAGNRLSPVHCTAYRVEGKPGCITAGRTVLNCILTVLEIKYHSRTAFMLLSVRLRPHSFILMSTIETLTCGSTLGLNMRFVCVRNCSAKCFCFAEHVASYAVEASWVQSGVYGKGPQFFSDFKPKIGMSPGILVKIRNIKCHDNTFSSFGVVTWGRTDRQDCRNQKTHFCNCLSRTHPHSDTVNAGVQCCRLLLTETECQSRLAP
jgi:hypothetical protein